MKQPHIKPGSTRVGEWVRFRHHGISHSAPVLAISSKDGEPVLHFNVDGENVTRPESHCYAVDLWPEQQAIDFMVRQPGWIRFSSNDSGQWTLGISDAAKTWWALHCPDTLSLAEAIRRYLGRRQYPEVYRLNPPDHDEMPFAIAIGPGTGALGGWNAEDERLHKRWDRQAFADSLPRSQISRGWVSTPAYDPYAD